MKYIDKVPSPLGIWRRRMMKSGLKQNTLIPLCFDERFLANYVGRLGIEPRIAIVELVANCWDAGSSLVDIQWPSEPNGQFKITDNGTGMSSSEFQDIWATIEYNRRKKQGDEVVFPPDVTPTARRAYGRNGKGRHSLFCFSDRYSVETWKDGIVSDFDVRKGTSAAPIDIFFKGTKERAGHGTSISCTVQNGYFPEDQVIELIGSKFITDPSFNLDVNEKKISFADFLNKGEHSTIALQNNKTIDITLITSQPGRTSLMQGIAWWVNGRSVREPSWEGVEGILIDGRTKPSRVYTFIVQADALADDVYEDWMDFKDTAAVRDAKTRVSEFVLGQIADHMQEFRKDAKIMVLGERKGVIKSLSDLSRERAGTFVDELQTKYPRMGPRDLSYALDVFASMELARSGYDLLRRLAAISPDDIDGWNDVLSKWSANDAKIVLDELQKRLEIIEYMETLTDNPSTKELIDLQPLFEKSLWLFGPEYEGIKYFSNRALVTILKAHVEKETIPGLSRRPDFAILSDSTIGIYASDRYEKNEAAGIDKILLVELKGGGSEIGVKEIRQGQDYTKIVRDSGKVKPKSEIRCFVLGASVDPSVNEPSSLGPGNVTEPKAYADVVKMAHARTFYLMDKIKETKGVEIGDKEVDEVLAQRTVDDEY
jgi:hypothetical protein